MKRYIFTILFLLLLPLISSAQEASFFRRYWQYDGTNLSPIDSSWDVSIGGNLVVTGTITVGGITMTADLDADGYDIIMDTDGDTAFVNDRDAGVADDEIDIKVANAVDFTISANDFTAVAGSTLSTDYIDETTGANGVYIDGARMVDGGGIFSGNVAIGATSASQELDIVGDIELEDTTSNDTGIIYKGATRFLHNFKHPTGGGAVPTGNNIFLGKNAGNFTMGSTATEVYHGSYNSAVGVSSLSSNTTGYNNSAVGASSLQSNTTGYNNSAVGASSLQLNTTGYFNSVLGASSLSSNTTGYYNSALGRSSLELNTTGYNNSAVGVSSLSSNTTGYNNSAVGLNAGRYIANGSDPNQTSNTSLYLGSETKASADGNANEIVIGYNATGNGSNTATYGNSSITKHIFTAGNVGIGDSSPSYELDVAGDADIQDVLYTGATSINFEDGGRFMAFDIPCSSSVADGDVCGYSFGTDGLEFVTVYAEGDGSGSVDTQRVGIGTTSPGSVLEVETETDSAVAGLLIDQDDIDEPFIEFEGTSDTDASDNISTMNGDGAVEGPKNYSSSNGWQFEGMVRMEVNGTDYWMPYYSVDTD